ncbi:MAG: hypothetical protein N2037_13285, partial [Acidimicrobiales bacterium]|nr:hypothetical protein [Acidimicrobiales bacterium]
MAQPPGTPSADDAQPAGAAAGAAAGVQMAAVPALRFSTWSIVRAVLVVAAGLVVLAIVQSAETPLWWIAISAVIAALLTPLSLRLARVMPTALAIAVVIVGALGAGGVTVYRGLSEVSHQVSELKDDALGIAQDLEASEQYGSVATEFGLAQKVTEFFEGLPAYVGGGDATEVVQAATSNAGSLVAIGFLLLLLMISGRQLVSGAVAQLFRPPARHEFDAVLS